MPANPIIADFDSSFLGRIGTIGSTQRVNVQKINGVLTRPKCISVDTTVAGTSGVGNFQLRLSSLNTPEVIVDWGDGTNDTITTAGNYTHNYASAGTYDVTIYGSYTHTSFGQNGYTAEAGKWKDIFTWQWFSGAVGFGAFNGVDVSSSGFTANDAPADAPVGPVTVWFQSLAFSKGLSNWDVSQVTSWDRFLANTTNYNEDLSNWDVSGTTTFARLFEGATAFNNSSVLGWDVSGVSSFDRMFRNATSFNQPLRWQMPTTSFVFPSVFAGASAFNQDISYNVGADGAWDMSQCTSLSGAFASATAFNTSIDNWNTGEVTSLESTFERSNYSAGLNSWDVSKVKSFRRTFWFANTGGDLDQWDVSAGTDFNNMFIAAGTAVRNLGAWAIGTNLAVGETVNMNGAFQATGGINPDVSNWDGTKVRDFQNCFERCSSFTGQGLSTLDTSQMTNMRAAFSQASLMNANCGNFDFSGITNAEGIRGLFDRCTAFNSGATAGVSNNNLNWTLPSTITSLQSLFNLCVNFNSDVRYDAVNGYWDTSNITVMNSTFNGCTSFNQDISNWDVSSVTDFTSCFENATIFNAPIGSWNVSAATTFSRMFYSTGVNSWTQSLTGWTTSALESISNMFFSTTFDQDISGWDITNLTSATTFLANNNGSFSTANYDAILDSTTGWPSQTTPQSGVTWGMGTTQYTSGGNAEAGRNVLTGTYGWTITDGGPI